MEESCFFLRGYLGLCAVEDVRDDDGGWSSRLFTAVRRFPVVVVSTAVSYVGLVLTILAVLAVGGLLIPDSLLGLLLLGIVGVVILSIVLVFQVKFLLVPEACYVGGAGVLGALKKSWRAVRLRRAGTVVLAGSFSLIVGYFAFDGASDGTVEGWHVSVSVATTAVYSALFAHLYLKREAETRRKGIDCSETR